jgi:DNA-directed RNA polymerase sigma subunit (sigma70/sigma32)
MGAELAEEIGEKPDKVRELLGFCRQPMSLDRKVGEALETDLGELSCYAAKSNKQNCLYF